MLLTTERLILRPFEESDFNAVHSYAGNYNNLIYTIWGPNTEEDTKAFLQQAKKSSVMSPCSNYQFAVTLKHNGLLIGGCGISLNNNLPEAEIGWVLNLNYHKQGYGAELGHELIRFGFEDLKLHRILAYCNALNYGSYRIMERNGMRREGHYQKCRLGRPCDSDKWYEEFQYAILDEEWNN